MSKNIPPVAVGPPCAESTPEICRIHESTISLRFLGIIWRFLRLEVSTNFVFGLSKSALHEQT
jgi:hypothetical protein